eukprot:101952-Heterocapsa_arctica.AAC.1
MVAQRALVHMARTLLHAPPEEAQAVKLEQQLQALSKRRPERVTGRHVFLSDAMATIKGNEPQVAQCMGKAVMQRHASVYQALPLEAKKEYEARAKLRAQESRHIVDGDISLLEGRVALFRNRLTMEHIEVGAQFRLAD